MDISIESLEKEFDAHINVEANYRIIFSGKFGTGKTFFLNKYFENRDQAYNKILISPVNYVISANEDIFELIKADILKQLFSSNKIRINELPEDNLLQKISAYIEDNPLALPKFMVRTLSKINPAVETPVSIIEAIGKLIEDYRKQTKPKQNEKTLEKEVAEYLDDSETKIGSIYEYNYITKAVNVFLKEIKGDKKNVLIIDDLDRIDPDHIFRILNVFSAHNNQFGEENKFLFDHVILVCDIHNIEKIFEHKYGKDVDFEGYIDKFYSTDIFHFSNLDAIKNYVQLQFGDESNSEKRFLVLILIYLINTGSLSVRKIIKHKFDLSFKNFVLSQQQGIKGDVFHLNRPSFIELKREMYVDSNDLPILNFFKLMSVLYGNSKMFLDNLRNIKEVKDSIDYVDCKEVLSFLALQYHISTSNGDDLYVEKFYDDNSGRKFLVEIGHPIAKLFSNRTFDIRVKWHAGNKYDGGVSYFEGALAIDREAATYFNGKSGINIPISDIFKAVEAIFLACYKKGFLRRAGIHFSIER